MEVTFWNHYFENLGDYNFPLGWYANIVCGDEEQVFRNWCSDNFKGPHRLLNATVDDKPVVNVHMEDEHDALLFKLTWGGEQFDWES